MIIPIAFLVYIIVGITNLTSAWFENRTLLKISKYLLLPVLLLTYLFGSEIRLIWFILAIVLGWIGDVLLSLNGGPVYLRLGLVAFLLGHIGYSIGFLVLAQGVHFSSLVISLVVTIPLCVLLLKSIAASPDMKKPVAVYGAVIFIMCISALQLLIADVTLGTALIFTGALVFIYSDAQMAYFLFHRIPKRYELIVMAPYILAQGLIVLGLTLFS